MVALRVYFLGSAVVVIAVSSNIKRYHLSEHGTPCQNFGWLDFVQVLYKKAGTDILSSYVQ